MKLKQKLAIGYIRVRLRILSMISVRAAAKKALDIFCTPFERSGTALPPLFAKGEPQSFMLQGVVIRGHRWPGRQAGSLPAPKVLIVHGWQSSSRNFEQYIETLMDKGYEVLAFDGPAHGQSGGRRITLQLYIEMLAHILKTHGPIEVFIGHSFGGLALSLLLENTAAAAGSRMVLIAPACEAVRAVDEFFHLLHLDANVRKAFDVLGVEITGKPFSWFSIRRAMHGLGMPILWVQDEEDWITPFKDALAVRGDAHPNIRWVITKGLGHRKIYRDAEIQRRIVEFIA